MSHASETTTSFLVPLFGAISGKCTMGIT